jgi:hypothetical protein
MSKARVKSVARGKAKKAKRTSKAERAGRAKKKAKATKTAKVVKAVVASGGKLKKRKVVRKLPAVSAPAASAKRSLSPRVARAALTVKQAPRAERYYAVKPKPVIQPVVELAVPELAVTTSGQGEVPAGGE